MKSEYMHMIRTETQMPKIVGEMKCILYYIYMILKY
jgi:hypothetical protein